ncbi:MAG TPA: phosphoribosylformylglycinamidine cyclo-ligase [Synergistales bacterium]|nr:phosphoribosylformylglycinamidine cyclo-ligase [Synergistales bacterium]
MEWTYERAGVSLQRSDAWIDLVRKIASRASSPNVLSGIGGFSGLYRLGGGKVLAACTDGVGTKLEVARMTGSFRGLGQDLVAMNVNDLVTCGARPLFFLDYIACGRLDADIFGPVMEGIAESCSSCGCALLGGETAEMPGVYHPGSFDLAGFAVGIVEEACIIDGARVSKGDVLLGLASSGLHSNGFSLVRKCLLDGDEALAMDYIVPGDGKPLSEVLMRPTRLYVKVALEAASSGAVTGMAHITGGGLEENIFRILPGPLRPKIDFSTWERPPVFGLIRKSGVDEKEMRRVFNLGIGFVLIVRPRDVQMVSSILGGLGETVYVIGEVSS